MDIERIKLRIKYTLETIDGMIDEEQQNLDRYKDLCEKNPNCENICYTADLNISRNIINLKSLKERLTDTLKELN